MSNISSKSLPTPVLRGVDHTARPTWKLAETVHFYRDVLGLPLVHVITARGWGPATHPDFLHLFFDSGNGSTIAFFYYLGSEPPPDMKDRPVMAPVPNDHVFDATHTAWLVNDVDELMQWRSRLESQGLDVSVQTTHEVIESIYVRDPNGYFIEFTRKLRALNDVDAIDATLTLAAAIEAENRAREEGRRVDHIDEIWARKAELLEQRQQDRPLRPSVRIFVPRVPEFASLASAAQDHSQCQVVALKDYDLIETEQPVEFERRALGLKPAVWYGLFTGGMRGHIEVLDRERVRILPR